MEFTPPKFVTVQGRKLAYEEVVPPNPQGTVLLLTGLASKRQGWLHQLPVFGRTYRTIALDHRDTGDSDLATVGYSTRDQADDAAGVLDALGIDRAHIVGISMGGFIALQLAEHHPDKVAKLVLTSTSAGGKTHVPASRQIGLMLVRPRWPWTDIGQVARRTYTIIMAPGYAASHPDEMENIATIARHRPQSGAAYRRQLNACLQHDATARLKDITAPTLVVHGEEDPLVPFPNGVFLAEQIPGARLVRYADTGHIPTTERMEDYNRDVLAFLAE
jgi:3-oxoadipate enol-lactonase